jgi:MFS family permease
VLTVQRNRVLLSITAGVFLGGIGGGIVFPILPILGLRYGLSPALLGLILAANRISRLACNAPVGAAVDRWGAKRPLVAGFLVEALGTGGFWYALRSGDPGAWFLAARVLWGLGSAGVFVGALTLALNVSRSDDRGTAVGLVRSALSLGTPAGLVTGGIIAGAWGDGAAFLSATAASLVAFLAGVRVLPDPRPATRRGGGWREFWRDIWLGLRNRRVLAVGAVNFLSFFSLQGVLLATLVLLVASRHLSIRGMGAEPSASLLLATFLVASAVATTPAGRFSDRARSRAAVALPGLLAVMLGFTLIGFARTPLHLSAVLALMGLGMGALLGPVMALIGDLVPASERGRVVGAYQFCGDLGGTLGPIAGIDAVTRFGFTFPYVGVAALLALGLPVVAHLGRVAGARGR